MCFGGVKDCSVCKCSVVRLAFTFKGKVLDVILLNQLLWTTVVASFHVYLYSLIFSFAKLATLAYIIWHLSKRRAVQSANKQIPSSQKRVGSDDNNRNQGCFTDIWMVILFIYSPLITPHNHTPSSAQHSRDWGVTVTNLEQASNFYVKLGNGFIVFRFDSNAVTNFDHKMAASTGTVVTADLFLLPCRWPYAQYRLKYACLILHTLLFVLCVESKVCYCSFY